MSGFWNSLKTVNSTVRTVTVLACMGGLGYGGWFGYENYLKPGIEAKSAKEDLAELRDQFEEQKTAFSKLQGDYDVQGEHLEETKVELVQTQKEKERIETSLKLMKVDRRLANIEVLDTFEKDGKPHMKVRFGEVDSQGNLVGASREFELKGTKFYVDCWIVSFLDHYVEGGDDLRACSLCVFKSIFGDLDIPAEGYSLDQQSSTSIPGIYAVPGKTEFEQEIWDNFWKVCNSPDEQEKLGIRAIHGQANYVVAEKGKVYQVNLRSSGSASVSPLK